jgi:hypothetical protein
LTAQAKEREHTCGHNDHGRRCPAEGGSRRGPPERGSRPEDGSQAAEDANARPASLHQDIDLLAASLAAIEVRADSLDLGCADTTAHTARLVVHIGGHALIVEAGEMNCDGLGCCGQLFCHPAAARAGIEVGSNCGRLVLFEFAIQKGHCRIP